jgi:hypothetical protein
MTNPFYHCEEKGCEYDLCLTCAILEPENFDIGDLDEIPTGLK